ncbi:chlorite dismutase family protein [Nitrospina watsonii]|uniref:Chlorite dismutase n=1 Tax=Nitrospina watsonii TaxID=1323948 RepID=A0ABN8W5Z0_9BACT|nr:chlorite dismutase family protein [Nitrospina watsonii]CAI2719503.1 conserved exported protein of unknown function [Nitrospina watsonii]
MCLRIKHIVTLAALMLCALGALPVHAAQGQWGGFIYLLAKPGMERSEAWKQNLIAVTEQAAQPFDNDFTPEPSRLATIHYIRTVRYTLHGEPFTPIPLGVIRVESMDRDAIRQFYDTFRAAAGDTLDLNILYGVTSELRYTDAETLERLKEHAPQRGPGSAQPNAVVFPLSKSAEWWTQTQEQREAYFFQHPDRFGKEQRGHNAIGFRYIDKIYRKLYQSRFIGGGADFITYFEYADADRDAFDSLLSGLRDTTLNPEWKFVEEAPIVYGTRVNGLADILNP